MFIANTEFKKILSKGVAKVTFEKVSDGSVRIIRGTCNTAYMPEECIPQGYGQKSDPDLVCTIFDLDKVAWRSFRWANIIKVEIV